ncbi:MAG: hypothetical protein HYZ38_20710 [Mycobacterium sp.]|nr:hypothetical protein [Mycobacterium sp.]
MRISQLTMDHTVPEMPIREAPQGALIAYTVLMILITLGFFIWWGVHERKRGPALVLFLIGGALSGLMEPWLDNVVLVGYPPDQITPTFAAFERVVPIFVPIGYAWFCGGLLYLLYRAFTKEFTARRIWALYGIIAVIDFIAIGLSAWIGILEFFGDPPMKIAGFVVWWAAIDALQVVLGATLAVFLVPALRGAQRLWLILIPSVALGAAAGIVGWPISTALNSGWPMWAKYLCAFASIGLSLACTHFVARSAPRIADHLRHPQSPVAPATRSYP